MKVAVPANWSRVNRNTASDPRVAASYRGPRLPHGVVQGMTIRVGPSSPSTFSRDLDVFVALQRITHPGSRVVRRVELSRSGAAEGMAIVFDYTDHAVKVRKLDLITRERDGSAAHVVEQSTPAQLDDATLNSVINSFRVDS